VNAAAGAALGIFVLLVGTVIGDLCSEEIHGRLDQLPRAVLRLASRRVPAELRAELLGEWLAELHQIMRGAEALPLTRLVRGLGYATGLLQTSPGIVRLLGKSPLPRRRWVPKPARRRNYRRRDGTWVRAHKRRSYYRAEAGRWRRMGYLEKRRHLATSRTASR
jgi:hypothetical protein